MEFPSTKFTLLAIEERPQCRKPSPDVLAANESLTVNCSSPACFHSIKLDVGALTDRLGP